MDRMTCPCCLDSTPTMEVRFDVKGRPYCICTSCSVRIFTRGSQSLVGLAMLAPLMATLAQEIRNDRATWETFQATRRKVEQSLRRVTSPEPEAATAEVLTAAAGAAR